MGKAIPLSRTCNMVDLGRYLIAGNLAGLIGLVVIDAPTWGLVIMAVLLGFAVVSFSAAFLYLVHKDPDALRVVN